MIIELAKKNKIPVMPHGGGLSASLYLSLNYSSKTIPLVEYNLSSEYLKQGFLKKNIIIDNGELVPRENFGLGIDFLPNIKEKYLKL
jgi:L-alanine-DL-glutamate epimerase-like enolase superfamily enzyme